MPFKRTINLLSLSGKDRLSKKHGLTPLLLRGTYVQNQIALWFRCKHKAKTNGGNLSYFHITYMAYVECRRSNLAVV